MMAQLPLMMARLLALMKALMKARLMELMRALMKGLPLPRNAPSHQRCSSPLLLALLLALLPALLPMACLHQ